MGARFDLGFLFGSLFGIVLGTFVGGIALIGRGVWEHGAYIGRQQAIHATDYLTLSTCARLLATRNDLHTTQLHACANVINDTLAHAGYGHLVEGNDHD